MAIVELIELLSKKRLAYESNALSLVVAEYFLDNYHYVLEHISSINIAREYLKKELQKRDIEVSGKYSNYVIIEFKVDYNLVKLCTELEKNKIYIRGPLQNPRHRCIIVTLGPLHIMDKFLLILDSVNSLHY